MAKMYCFSLFLAACLCSFCPALAMKDPGIEAGVSKKLADYRKGVISNVNYGLSFDIPAERNAGIAASEKLSFNLKSNLYSLQLDFKAAPEKLKSIKVNGASIAIKYLSEHIVIAVKYLKIGSNHIEIKFEAGEGALNRNADYLYTLFVPDRARTVFPCFDQPDLKARYDLSLSLAADWSAMTNGGLKQESINGTRKTLQFKTSERISTYLFAFAAGKFSLEQDKVGQMTTDFLYRETDSAKLKNSMKEIFAIHDQSLRYFEDWTAIRYPFQKFGFVAIPDFQFGGMEHPGAIQYKAASLFLDGGATKDQLNARSNLIAHETAHMWFGDLVTMNWFTDVWMKEVFANFMADKSTEGNTGADVFDLKFLIDHFPAAYGIDRTTGSNPIRQPLDNLKDAGTLYGNIIYHKAPIMMRQLERLMGKEKFQQGVREYLKKFSNGNASWPDLIGILDQYADADLQSWNKVWVDETGRPIIDYKLEQQDGKITKFNIFQRPEYGKARIWPQLFELLLVYPDRTRELTVNLNSADVDLTAAKDMDVPLFVLFNSSGQGYGLWPVDAKMYPQLYQLQKPLNRASAYVSLYENMLNGRFIKPKELLSLLIEGLSREQEELNVKLICGYLNNIYWNFMTQKDREAISVTLENSIWAALQTQTKVNNKRILFKTYQDVFLSAAAKSRLYAIWEQSKPAPEGLKMNEDDYTALAFSLALRDTENTGVLAKQLTRISNPDRIKRFQFIMPAVSADVEERNQFFESLALKSNREKEANVATALAYLHHPLRQVTSEKYLRKSLELLSEIQVTGDIFFPYNWLQSTFGSYQSTTAAQTVGEFLQQHPDYNPKLKAKILQAADNLFRAEQLLKP
ncbi:M1 family metallopeptidase [Pedobacter sp. GR22-6]|uniref:M1 family metallopeptidase n=1 Tax=Pedobacter sp. GR22-6 TaxID=3127957 RepID=UPI00307F87D3